MAADVSELLSPTNEMVGSFQDWRIRISALPEAIARTRVAAPLLSVRTTNALRREGFERLEQLEGLSADRMVDFDGLGRHCIDELFDTLRTLCALPSDKLARLSTEPSVVPNVSVRVLAALCRANTVDHEIAALVADLPERNRALVLNRWGYCEGSPHTLEQAGEAFGITRERVRQLIIKTEWPLKHSGVRLPLATAAIHDLDEIGGATADADYQVLLHCEARLTLHALQALPALHELGCVPEIMYDPRTRLWLTSAGMAIMGGAGSFPPNP